MYSFSRPAQNRNGKRVENGIYYTKLSNSGHSKSIKIMVLKGGSAHTDIIPSHTNAMLLYYKQASNTSGNIGCFLSGVCI